MGRAAAGQRYQPYRQSKKLFDFAPTLGRAVFMLRRQAGLSRRQMFVQRGAPLEWTQQFIEMHHFFDPRLSDLVKIARAHGITVSELLKDVK